MSSLFYLNKYKNKQFIMPTILADLSLRLRASSAELQKGLETAKASLNGFKSQVSGTGKAMSSAFKEASSNIKGSLNAMTNGLSGMLQTGLSAFKGLITGVKGFATAFAATGIGAIILLVTTAIMGLVAAFKRSGEAGDKMAEAFGFIKGILNYLITQLVKVGEWIVKAFEDPQAAIKELWTVIKENLVTRFQGVIQLFTAGWEIIKNGAIGVAYAIKGIFNKEAKDQAAEYFQKAADGASKVGEAILMMTTGKTLEDIKKIGEEINNAGEAGMAIERQKDALDEQRIKNTVDLQRMETALIRTREQLAETGTKTEEDRNKRLQLFEQVLSQMNVLSQRRIAFAKQELDLVKAQAVAMGDTSDESRQKIADATARYEAEITKSVEETLRFKKGEVVTQQQINAEVAKQLEAENKVQDEIRQLNAETAILKIDDEKQAAIEKLKLSKENALANVEEGKYAAEMRLAIIENYAQQEIDLNKEFADKDKENSLKILDEKIANEKIGFEERQKLLEVALNNGIITKQEFDAKELELDDLKNASKLEKAQQFANMAMSLTDTLSNMYISAMNRELTAAGDNEAKKEAIQKKYARKQKAIAIAQAIINGALGITSSLTGPPIYKWIEAAMVAAATATQIAVISSTPLAKGGIAYGESLATVGEYANAKTNPEVIAPLSKLKDILFKTPEFGEVRFVIEQNQLVGILERYNKKNIYF